MRPTKIVKVEEKTNSANLQKYYVAKEVDSKAVRLFYKYLKQLIAEGSLQHLNIEYMAL